MPAQTISDLGRLVKSKHPEYSDIPDDEVGRKVKAKFPGAYEDFTDAPRPQRSERDTMSGPSRGRAGSAVADPTYGERFGGGVTQGMMSGGGLVPLMQGIVEEPLKNLPLMGPSVSSITSIPSALSGTFKALTGEPEAVGNAVGGAPFALMGTEGLPTAGEAWQGVKNTGKRVGPYLAPFKDPEVLKHVGGAAVGAGIGAMLPGELHGISELMGGLAGGTALPPLFTKIGESIQRAKGNAPRPLAPMPKAVKIPTIEEMPTPQPKPVTFPDINLEAYTPPQPRPVKIPNPPIEKPIDTTTGATVKPIANGEFIIPPVKGAPMPAQLAPIDKFEMNRMAHARAQELELPGSPAGKSGHAQLSAAAKSAYGVNSWADLTVPQMKAVHDFLDTHKRLPTRSDLPR